MTGEEMNDFIAAYPQNRVSVFNEFMGEDCRLNYSLADRRYGWYQMDAIFTGMGALPEPVDAMRGLFRQQMGGILQHVRSGITFLCPVPHHAPLVGQRFMLQVERLMYAAASVGPALNRCMLLS